MEQMEDGFGGAQLRCIAARAMQSKLRQGRLLQRKGMKVPDEVPEDGFFHLYREAGMNRSGNTG